MRYASPRAFRASLEQHLRTDASGPGGLPDAALLSRLRKRVTFERFLARLHAVAPGEWVLKGGFALELRLSGLARATKDIDVDWISAERDVADASSRLCSWTSGWVGRRTSSPLRSRYPRCSALRIFPPSQSRHCRSSDIWPRKRSMESSKCGIGSPCRRFCPHLPQAGKGRGRIRSWDPSRGRIRVRGTRSLRGWSIRSSPTDHSQGVGRRTT